MSGQSADDAPADNGWAASADAWVDALGERGDFARAHVLDEPMLALMARSGAHTVLDVGCGEGRFCRLLAERGMAPVGMDATAALIDIARTRDPRGTYEVAKAEHLPVGNAAFDAVVSYLALIDIEGMEAAIAEMARVVRPGGTILVANLTAHATANPHYGWIERDGEALYPIDHYLEERVSWVGWKGIRIRNWHRPLKAYMQAFLAQGLALTHFDEPAPQGGDPARMARYVRAPWFVITEWRKPA